jgi:hypothetical protein
MDVGQHSGRVRQEDHKFKPSMGSVMIKFSQPGLHSKTLSKKKRKFLHAKGNLPAA